MLERLYSGKVRDIYDVDGDLLLMVASDRISAFDVVFNEPIPDKGRVLTAMTEFWDERLRAIAPTHLVTTDPDEFPDGAQQIPDVRGRAMLVRHAKMLPIECIVRGYLSGSAWKEYRSTNTVHNTEMPADLKESTRLSEPLFTPSTKATEGHDVNISFEQAADLVGEQVASRAREICLAAYSIAEEMAKERDIIIADTKFELGFIDGELSICDEILTPDSSRFWPADAVVEGSSPPSYDKQPVRDWLESTGWDKASQPPTIPEGVIEATRARYIRAYEALSQRSFDDWWGMKGDRGR